MPGVDLKKRVRHAFSRLPAKLRKRPIFLAVSGGRDSTVLASVAVELRAELPPLHFIHVNYHLRIPDSDREEAFLRNWARKLGLPISVKRLFPKAKPKNLQAWARQNRFEYFFERMKKISAEGGIVWTAHHERDQAETVLERILRGAGIRGIGGMNEIESISHLEEKVFRPPLTLFRPLLEVPEESLGVYAKAHRLKFHVDRSNATDLYRRNRIRRQILPLLRKENPRVQEALCFLGRNARQAQHSLESTAQAWIQRSFGKKIPRRIPLKKLQKLPPGLGALILEHVIGAHIPQRLPLSQIIPRIQSYLDHPLLRLHIPLRGDWEIHLDRQYLSINKNIK